jgi:hypothetical protein
LIAQCGRGLALPENIRRESKSEGTLVSGADFGAHAKKEPFPRRTAGEGHKSKARDAKDAPRLGEILQLPRAS